MDRAQPLTITLAAEQWNLVLQILSEAQYRVAAPLISAIEQQARAQAVEEHAADPAALPPPDAAEHRGNGRAVRR